MSHFTDRDDNFSPLDGKRSSARTGITGPLSTPSSENEKVASVTRHEGKKYLRTIYDATTGSKIACVSIDIYEVLVAFDVTCPARAHAIKKLLTAGQRGKGDVLADLKGALAALLRAIELQERQELLNKASNKETSNG